MNCDWKSYVRAENIYVHTHTHIWHTHYTNLYTYCLLSGPASSNITDIATFGTGLKNNWTPLEFESRTPAAQDVFSTSGKHSCSFAAHSLLCSSV